MNKLANCKPETSRWHKNDIYVEVITITPKMANDMLAIGNHRDRPLSPNRVKKIADAIRRGEWRTNTDCIGFDIKGNRVNGQHRLNAIIEADVPVTVLVAYNLPIESFMTTDIGARRGAGDLAAIIGMRKNYSAVGAAINLLWRYEKGAMHVRYELPTNTQVCDLLQKNRGIEESAVVGKSVGGILSPGTATFCHYIFNKIDADKAKSFFDSLRTGANLSEGNPILVLRNRLASEKNKKGFLPAYETIALVIKAWNYYRNKRKVKYLRWNHSQGEVFPIAI